MVFETAISSDSFWDSVNILITRPHLCNKRLWGSKILNTFKTDETNQDKLIIALKNHKLNSTRVLEIFKNNFTYADTSKNTGNLKLEVILIELLPKIYEEVRAFQVVFLDKINVKVIFCDVTPEHQIQKLCPNFPYTFCLYDSKIILETNGGDPKTEHWLKESVMPCFVKWNSEINTYVSKFCSGSLNLLDVAEYYEKYNHLKLKYGRELVKIWPECTDPAKFVYEDIAIATYLLLLWSNTSSEKIRFLDIGCGNGLLVYILTMEGHSGIGVDVRKRKIWDMYPVNVMLQEFTVTPSNSGSFTETDWIIGNHSDEMTPWIPIIASRNSVKCNFFLLPCCAYNIDGTKYQRQNSSKSQYMEYLEYIKNFCDSIGFETIVDRLKIPSTKRICLVGKKRSHTEKEHEYNNNYINKVLSKELHTLTIYNGDQEFKAREAVERVRNCTQVDKTVIDTIISCVTKYLLSDINFKASWSPGREVEIQELIKLIPKDKLKMLKSECGGLQTLLKNNHHIFKVVNGTVTFRYPKTISEVKENLKNKHVNTHVRPCWFHINHPQGCPLDDNVCSFLHTNIHSNQ
ncbi:probable tRNA (uracil-O(2)-)-methyltransferase isoform X1 [Leptidea sinapis]|uniref:probable tRNA (uracil-O(2)-)-methyltransferase isoform X1 n=2 Tax=Leptidea sinapis TaxID=189913 RepID=UPI0021451B30|nr:probable tRNA (uracil-O(2)-)-methyltransferase isoform X1 [Leptidea sinapis]